MLFRSTVDDADGALRVRGPFRTVRVSLAQSEMNGPGGACAVAIAGEEPVDFTIEIDDDGTVLVAQPGQEARFIGAADVPVAVAARGQA